jgi:hypothetical protein
VRHTEQLFDDLLQNRKLVAIGFSMAVARGPVAALAMVKD